jgi:hypothetical protein
MKRFRLLRALLVAITAVVGLGLLGVLVIRVYGAHRFAEVSERYEREIGPLSVSTFVRPKVAVENNAATWQRAGVSAVVFFPGDQQLVGSLSATSFAKWTAADSAKLEAILVRNRPAIELLEHARGMKDSNWEIPYEQGSEAKIPNLLAALNAAKLLNARGRFALGRGDSETAITSAEALGALARSHQAESATIVLLIGLAIEKLQIALVQELTIAERATSAELDRLEASLCDADLTHAVRQSLRGSAAAIAHDLRAQSLAFEVHGAVQRRIAGALSDIVAAAAIESHRDAEKYVGERIRAPLDETDAEQRRGGWWNHLLRGYGADFESVSARATALASARGLAKMAIALRREALARGRYPASLPAIEGISVNDPLTGEPRAYDVKADGSAELRSTTTVEIARSIAPASQLSYDALYRWVLPAPR